MLQMTFELLGFEMFEVRLQKKPLQPFLYIHKGAIFDRSKIKHIFQEECNNDDYTQFAARVVDECIGSNH
jgi:hypothetical protein